MISDEKAIAIQLSINRISAENFVPVKIIEHNEIRRLIVGSLVKKLVEGTVELFSDLDHLKTFNQYYTKQEQELLANFIEENAW